MSTKLIDEKIAYAAMYEFLVDYYKRTRADDIGVLLGGMSLLPDGSPVDSAIWSDWINSVTKAREKTNNLSLNLRPTYTDYK